jgi:DNA topoisomerase-1
VRELEAGRGKQFLQPTEFGLQVDGLMSHAFPELVSEGYTASMEAGLDAIERGSATRPAWLRAWYDGFRAAMARAESLGRRVPRAARAARAAPGGGGSAEDTTATCDRCGEATYRKIARKGGKGSFLACPACRMTRDVRAKVRAGACPTCGSALIVKKIGKMEPFWGCVRYGADATPCAYREPMTEATAGVGGRATAGAAAAEGGTATAAPARRARRSPRARAGAAPPWTTQPTDKGCPRCGARALEVRTPTNPAADAPCYACPDAACGFTLPLGARRRRLPCPACAGVMLERRDGAAPEWRCARCAHVEAMVA